MAVTAPIAAGAWFFTNSWLYAALAVLAGVMVDADHVFDYIREEKKFEMKGMFIKSYKGDFEYLYIFFHAWEYIPLSFLIGALINNYTFSIVFSIAYFAHLLPDQLLNNTRPWGYSLIYRIIQKFEMRKIFYPPKGRPVEKSKVKSKKSKGEQKQYRKENKKILKAKMKKRESGK